MAYKLVVADIVEVPVKFSVNDAGKTSSFFFHLNAKRLSPDELRSLVDSGANEDRSVTDFLIDQVVGWRGQRLVVEDDGTPAPFSADAFRCMLGLLGVAGVVFAAYVEACGAQGKAKN